MEPVVEFGMVRCCWREWVAKDVGWVPDYIYTSKFFSPIPTRSAGAGVRK